MTGEYVTEIWKIDSSEDQRLSQHCLVDKNSVELFLYVYSKIQFLLLYFESVEISAVDMIKLTYVDMKI